MRKRLRATGRVAVGLLAALAITSAGVARARAFTESCSKWCNPDCRVFVGWCDACYIEVNNPVCNVCAWGCSTSIECTCDPEIFWTCENSITTEGCIYPYEN